MAIRNTAEIYIRGRNFTHYAVMPLKWGNLLDERLDEMYLSLRMCPVENFKPLTPVEIHYSNQLYFGKYNDGNPQTQIKRYLVADDANVQENPVGRNLYDHDIYLIELTKILECITVDTNTVTNDLGRIYTENAEVVSPSTEIITEVGNPATVFQDLYFQPTTPNNYLSPFPSYEIFTFQSFINVFPAFWQQWQNYSWAGYPFSPVYEPYMRLRISFNGSQIYLANRYYDRNTQQWFTTGDFQNSYSTTVQTGTYTIEYLCELASYRVYTDSTGVTQFELNGHKTSTVTYTILTVENYYPLKSWTITDVINRLFDIAEPLRQGDKPRFRLQGVNADGSYASGSQAEKFDKILAPQFSFTKSTLRECLQQCGAIVHGEPRVDIGQDADGTYFYEVSFDLYGQTDRAGIYAKRYIKKTVSQLIDNYATSVDSNAENLVNQLDKYSGVITEPYASGYKTVRTETLYVRITDANMLIQTQYPIYSVEKLECGYIPNNGSVTPPVDVTPYVFESSVYNSRLSSYTDQYPYSKAYALYYTQGQKNINGLNFKHENPISNIFSRYAIINILRAATGNDSINIDVGANNQNDYPLLAFRVTYIPFYTSRVGQTKVNYKDYPYGASLIYNQQANVIESRYYGENLKGVIARIGNVEKSMTFILARLHEIPTAGQMYDEDYYISAVSVEFLPTFIKCTLGLSKDFNRLSQYIGISSVKRFSEVSQGQAVERNTLWKEYIVVGDAEEADTDCYIGGNFLSALADTFTQTGAYLPITNIAAWGSSYGGSDLPAVYLPVVSSAFGNSIAFSWTYEDNYSAGAISEFYTNTYTPENGDTPITVSGYFQNNYRYTDYYGRMYYYNFDLQQSGPQISNAGQQGQIGTELPAGEVASTSSGYISTLEGELIILRKDNREALQCNFQVDLVSNRKGLIIGSALAAYCPLVRGGADSSLAAKLYIFDEPLNKFINHVEGSLDIDLSGATAYDITVNAGVGTFSVTAGAFSQAGKAWAICTQQTERSQTVEDEQGNVTTQTVQTGGDVLVAQNMDFAAGDSFPTVHFTKKKEVFDKSVWIANK